MADEEGGLLDQSEIEALFGSLSQGEPTRPASAPTPTPKSAGPAPSAAPSAPKLSGPAPTPDVSLAVKPFELSEASAQAVSTTAVGDVSLIYDVDLNVRVELGRTRMYIEDVLRLREGSIIPLDKLAGDPVDVFVNGQLLARGEVLVLNDNFCVRISEVLDESEPTESAR